MQEHIPSDIFVWLYLSLFIHINQQAGKKQDSYTQYEMDNELSFVDPDAEVEFDPFIEDADLSEFSVNKPSIDTDNFYVKYIDSEDKRALLNLKVELIIENNKIYVNTPFDKDKTSDWMNRRFQEARNICPELVKLIEENYIESPDSQEKVNIKNDIVYQKNVADQLDVCGTIYRLVESINIPNPDSQNIQKITSELKSMLIKIDKYFTGKSNSYFVQ
jgi:hypothetical protein